MGCVTFPTFVAGPISILISLSTHVITMAGVSDDVLGKFQLDKSENFDAFMAAVGVGWATRTIGNKTTPVVTVTKDDSDMMTFKQESLVSTSAISFKVGEQFDEKTADGRQVKSTMTLEAPNVLKHEMLGTNGGKDSVCVRKFLKDHMECICTWTTSSLQGPTRDSTSNTSA